MDTRRKASTLRQRIEENDGVRTIRIDRNALPGHAVGSFSERYRGTEWETPTETAIKGQPAYARGRAFVVMLAAALAITASLAILASP